MVDVTLRPMTEADLPVVSEIRHWPETLRYLHDDRTFSLPAMRRWFHEQSPRWWIISVKEFPAEIPVGYIRTSEDDERNASIKIGADIHPQHRRKGYATAAYQQFIKEWREKGYRRFWLEVLPTNLAAIELYKKLGFMQEGRKYKAVLKDGLWFDSILMSLVFESPSVPA